MKKLIIIKYLFLHFLLFSLTLQGPSFSAEKLGEFEIEGILLKESLLNYFDKKKIDEKKTKGFIYPKKDFYSVTFSSEKFTTYDKVQFHLNAEDKEYKIYSLSGQIIYENNIKKCYRDMSVIVSEIKSMFDDPKIIEKDIESHSRFKDTKVKTTYIDLRSLNYQEAAIVIECYDWSELQTKQFGRKDLLSISVDSIEFYNFISN